jgi:phage I-like protein
MNTITASFSATGFEGKAPDVIVFFPKGLYTVKATKAGTPTIATVNATMELAGILNAQLQAGRNAAMTGTASRPFIDFAHKRDAAAAIPTEIFWDEDRGVMCSLEWTKSGKEAVEGKDFSYFSPEFVPVRDNSASLNLPYSPIGGLVNAPAFQTIGPIAANLNNQPSMTTIIAALKKFGVEVKDDADETAVCSALEGKINQLSNALTTAKASLSTYETKEKEAVAAALAKEADTVVSAALADGKITDAGPWKTAYLASPDTVKAQLAALPAKPDGHCKPIVTVTAAAAKTGAVVATRAEFDAMSFQARDAFFKSGGKLSD